MILNDFVNRYANIGTRATASVRAAFYEEMKGVFNDVVARSPVDSKEFISNWQMVSSRGTGVVAGYTIRNKTFYGPFLDLGANKGAAPWYFPNKNNPGPTSKSGKLTYKNGRVWAGGKSPYGFVIGGIINPVIYDNNRRQLKIAEAVLDSIVGVL